MAYKAKKGTSILQTFYPVIWLNGEYRPKFQVLFLGLLWGSYIGELFHSMYRLNACFSPLSFKKTPALSWPQVQGRPLNYVCVSTLTVASKSLVKWRLNEKRTKELQGAQNKKEYAYNQSSERRNAVLPDMGQMEKERGKSHEWVLMFMLPV